MAPAHILFGFDRLYQLVYKKEIKSERAHVYVWVSVYMYVYVYVCVF